MTAERRATAWILAMCGVWGSSFITMKVGLEGMARGTGGAAAPAAFIFLRFAAAALLFAPLFPRAVARLNARTVLDGLALAVPFYAGFILQVNGLRFTTATVSAFLTSLSVVLTPILGRLFFREALSWANVAGAVVALAGVWVLTDPGGVGLGPGELLTAAAAVAFTFQLQLTNVVTRRSDPEGVTFVMFLAAVAFSGATLAVLGVGPRAIASALGEKDVAWTVLYNAVLCSVVAITLMNRYQRDLAPTRAAVLYTLEPVFAAAFAWAWGEALTLRLLAGGGIIVGGNLVCELFAARAAAGGATGRAAGAAGR